MRFLFLFMDGIGLSDENSETNPFATVHMPNMQALLGDKRMVKGWAPLETERATLLELDASMGVDGLPQSATGQAALVTGKNVPQLVGEHYGPKPNKAVAEIVRQDNLFIQLTQRGYRACLLNAYPQRYFDGISSGHRLYSAIPLAVTSAGIALKTAEDLTGGEGFSVDFTGQGWREQLGYKDSPLMEAPAAGRRLAAVTAKYDLAFFDFWVSDFVGHHQDMKGAVRLMESFDAVFGGLLAAWDDDKGLILITSDHGNMEDLSTRHHTLNPVPALVIGAKGLREKFCKYLKDLADVAPAILRFYP
ncbi:MAG TPA: hypothetical protein VF982_08615 [Anaerolineales bacterium]